jgi:IS30 family transposase
VSGVFPRFARHGGRAHYRAADADRQARRTAKCPQRCKLALNAELREFVEDGSPEKIAGWLKFERGEDHTELVSHETIYRTLLIQARGPLKRELLTHLRQAGSVRRPRVAKGENAGQRQIRDAIPDLRASR